ncbi:hypothetical protein LXM94_11660 [Rhizobium sp. TRM95111]|uniref:hypothetical protein n=1 Tax=Rhizobium alarense TaxID=2846851 RepID=UPI001F3BF9F5|nr:hypothetical protein [Rhizobium alarense]MCF3640621.1 hypothetical protein [Rhizobium alarense]
MLVNLSDEVRSSGFGYFGALADLKGLIEKITGHDVDILPEPIQKDELRQRVERDRIVAF